MTHWQSPSPEFSARLEQLAALCLMCRDSLHEIADAYHWTPAPGSPGARDAIALPSPDPQVPSPHGETGHRLLAEIVQSFLLTASGHLGGLAGLYLNGEITFSPPLLIRAVIENCAHAVWVLGEDGEDADDRLARCYLEERKSAEEAKKNSGYMYGKTASSYAHAADAYKKIQRQTIARFPDTTMDRLGRYELHGQRLPRLEDAVTDMYALTEAAGGTITVEQASGIYGFLSNMTHPTLYPARQRRGWYSDPEHSQRVAYLHVEIGSTEQEARAALAAFYNALTYTTSYFGWPTTIVESLEARIEAVIPTFFQ